MHRTVPVVAVVAASMIQPTVGWAQRQGYAVSVGLLTVSSSAGDALSSTDFQVRIRRGDQAMQARISSLDDRMSQLDGEADQLLVRMSALRRKKQQSEIEPGPPLTAAERERLTELSALPLAGASDSQARELRRLNSKDEASSRQPGPTLSEDEEAELQSLAVRRNGVLSELRNTRSARSSALALISGRTRIVDSDSLTLDFNSGPVLTVYEGDVLGVTVVDVDLFVDDVFGTHLLNVTRQILERGTVRLGSSGSIRSLELDFAPTSRSWLASDGSGAAGPSGRPRVSLPRSSPAASPVARGRPPVAALLADAVAAEVDGRAGDALVHYTAVLRHDELNPTALAGRERAEAGMKRAWSGERLEAGNTAFAAGRYDDARRLFQYAFNLEATAEAAEGLRRVDNVQAIQCRGGATCGTLAIRVTPAAEIFVDDRSLGVAADLELHVAGGRYRVRLETVRWRFPHVLHVEAGATTELVVDLEEDGFPKSDSLPPTEGIVHRNVKPGI